MELENEILARQLGMILEKLGALYAGNGEVKARLQHAEAMLKKGDITNSAEELHVD